MAAKKKQLRKMKSGLRKANHLAATLKNGLNLDKQQLIQAAKKLSKNAANAEQTVEAYTKEHPWQAIGLSVLAGLIVGQIFRR